MQTYPFENADGTPQYWRDVGTLASYYDACMDLIAPTPALNLYDPAWPIRCYQPIAPPPKFLFNDGEDRVGRAVDSLVCSGSIISGGSVVRSILSAGVRVESYARVEDSILFDGVQIGRDAVVRRAILDKNIRIPDGMTVGVDAEQDRARGFTVTDDGLTVVGRDMVVE